MEEVKIDTQEVVKVVPEDDAEVVAREEIDTGEKEVGPAIAVAPVVVEEAEKPVH